MTEIKGEKSFLFFEESESQECFEAGGKKLFVYDDTFDLVIVNGIIKFADNSTAYCLLKINEQENGELIDVGVWTRVDGVCPIVFASHPKFLSFLGKKKEQMFSRTPTATLFQLIAMTNTSEPTDGPIPAICMIPKIV